ncbi:MDR family MFS transporter [Bradyrhizobium canariense]|uniref:Drug resistance transporter, EmrB/QacA subfamily n=1 Tax=Bradyrhizobium canariense TaxID=255045 RepID=A0A1H1TF55_9BRAD|nr:MDR family MFS transporter [Bradyrhizobium canariense]SDS58917.1 drug resistance transporter, EmrB/QacA subfamily [Bradyrhizobium canariense]
MNKYERQGPQSASHQTLPDAVALELSQMPTEVLDLSDAPPLAPRAPLTQSEVRTILMSLLLSMFLAALDQTIVATALPTIGRQFQDVSNLSWVITAYLLASTAVAPVFGTLSDIYGRRGMIIAALGLFVSGSILCAVAPNMTVLILARGLQGLGGGGIMPIVQTVISDVVTPRERGQYQAYFSGVWMAAGIGGPVLGGFFAEHLHWSMIFWINVPLGLIALATLLPKMGKIPVFHRKRKVDWLGGVLLMASAVVIMLVLTWGGNRYLWLSPTIIAMVGASIALTFAFVWHAGTAEEPFLPLSLMGGTVAPYAMAAGGCGFGAMLGLTVHLPLYYEVVYHLSASQAGLALIPLAAVSTGGAAIAGRTMARAKHYKLVAIIGTSCAALLGLALALTTLQLWALLLLLSVFALGLGTVFPVSVVALQNAVVRSQVGTVTGAMNFFRALMASFMVAAFSAILLMALGSDISLGGGEQHGPINSIAAADMIAAFRYVFGAAAALLACAALCMIAMEEKPLAGPVKPTAMVE